MLVHRKFMTNTTPTFDSPKVAKPRLPTPFFVSGGAFFNDRLVTFCTAVRPRFIHKWWYFRRPFGVLLPGQKQTVIVDADFCGFTGHLSQPLDKLPSF